MADNGDRGGARRRPWSWGAGIALGAGVGLVFGVVFVASLGWAGLAVGVALAAGLVPAFAMSMARRTDSDEGPHRHD
ncbi:hypothetical protein ACO229_14485 [Promicromonospora sp. MS192]|uniref:hypothetical protein n=1 Tax=Promicromonospora sp. MS192 TaxID=3412684 RepID=UPI003C2D29B3